MRFPEGGFFVNNTPVKAEAQVQVEIERIASYRVLKARGGVTPTNQGGVIFDDEEPAAADEYIVDLCGD